MWGEPGGPGAKLQPSRNAVRFRDPTPTMHECGDVREQANPAGCEPALRADRYRYVTPSGCLVLSPCPVSTMVVQPPCKRPVRVRFLHRAPLSALVHQLRRLFLTQENLGRPHVKLGRARSHLAGCSRSRRALEAREVGAKPTPAANDFVDRRRLIDHQLSRRPLKPENPGQHWMGRPF
jgi:hypothetical protein